MTTEDEELLAEIRGYVARGWRTDANKHKEMDAELAIAITDEVFALVNTYKTEAAFHRTLLKDTFDHIDEAIKSQR